MRCIFSFISLSLCVCVKYLPRQVKWNKTDTFKKTRKKNRCAEWKRARHLQCLIITRLAHSAISFWSRHQFCSTNWKKIGRTSWLIHGCWSFILTFKKRKWAFIQNKLTPANYHKTISKIGEILLLNLLNRHCQNESPHFFGFLFSHLLYSPIARFGRVYCVRGYKSPKKIYYSYFSFRYPILHFFSNTFQNTPIVI